MISFIKSIISTVLLFSFTLQVSANVLLWVHYEWNKTYISKTLCEKKDIPDSCCKGKCFLKKQVEKQEELPNTTNNTSKEQKSIKYQNIKDTFLDAFAYTFELSQIYSVNASSFCVYFLLQGHHKTLEKPPQVSFYC